MSLWTEEFMACIYWLPFFLQQGRKKKAGWAGMGGRIWAPSVPAPRAEGEKERKEWGWGRGSERMCRCQDQFPCQGLWGRWGMMALASPEAGACEERPSWEWVVLTSSQCLLGLSNRPLTYGSLQVLMKRLQRPFKYPGAGGWFIHSSNKLLSRASPMLHAEKPACFSHTQPCQHAASSVRVLVTVSPWPETQCQLNGGNVKARFTRQALI